MPILEPKIPDIFYPGLNFFIALDISVCCVLEVHNHIHVATDGGLEEKSVIPIPVVWKQIPVHHTTTCDVLDDVELIQVELIVKTFNESNIGARNRQELIEYRIL